MRTKAQKQSDFPYKLTERLIQLAIIRETRTAIVAAAPNYTPAGWWECDLWAVSKAGYATEYEIKLSASDFKADAQKSRRDWKSRSTLSKHDLLAKGDERGPSRFFYVVPANIEEEIAPLVPSWAGLATVYHNSRRPDYIHVSIPHAPHLHKRKVTTREIRLCQRRMWYRYWHSLHAVEQMAMRLRECKGVQA